MFEQSQPTATVISALLIDISCDAHRTLRTRAARTRILLPFLTSMQKRIFEPLCKGHTKADSGSETMPNRATFYFPGSMADPRYGGTVASLTTFPEHGIVVAVTSNMSYAETPALALKIARAFPEQARAK